MSGNWMQPRRLRVADPSSTLALFWLLAGMVGFGGLIVAADSGGWLDVLGWRKSPGVVLVSGLFLLTSILLRLRFAVCRALCVVALFGSSIVIGDRTWLIPDIVRLPVCFWLLAAMSGPLIGVFCICRMRVAVVLQAAFAVLGGCIQAVHMYNALHPGEHMGFFGPGWIS